MCPPSLRSDIHIVATSDNRVLLVRPSNEQLIYDVIERLDNDRHR